ncbi:MAG: hypothetical protein Q9184_007368, partial [Pyrenodesmia sp. 2 TL-2023]
NVSDWIPGHDTRSSIYMTTPVWKAMAWASDAEFTTIIEQAREILHIHVNLLRRTGRLEAFSRFAQAGIPEDEWEKRFLGMTKRELKVEVVRSASCYWYEGKVVPREGEQLELIPEVGKLARLLDELAVMTPTAKIEW